MAPLLSGNTLGLKFMQRGAAAKAATEARKHEDAKKEAEQKRQAEEKAVDSSEDEGSSNTDSDSDDEPAAPVASTSRLPTRFQSSITTENSYMAFPILSRAYGVATSVEATGPAVNGRISFGQHTTEKPERSKQTKSDTDTDEAGNRQVKDKEIKPKKQKLPHSISHTIHLGAQSNAGLSIRERQEKRAKGKQAKQEAKAKQPKAQAEADRSETRSAENTTKLNEDTSFVDDMMAQARQKRQLDNGNTGRNKKRKSEA